MDRHRFDADPASNLHVDTDPDLDPDSDWHQTMPILMQILPLVLRMLENQNIFLILFTALPDYNVILFQQCQMCHNFHYV